MRHRLHSYLRKVLTASQFKPPQKYTSKLQQKIYCTLHKKFFKMTGSAS